MVWFVCDGCGDTIKKPKLQNHFFQCPSHRFACVDCNQTFDRNSVKGHSTCVTEHEKYALGATKPGGYAANGFKQDGAATAAAPPQGSSEPSGLEFLTSRPPWKCSVCNVNCTSKETLMSHAAGVKHKRRARAALNAQQAAAGGPPAGQNQGNGISATEEKQEEQPQQQPATTTTTTNKTASSQQQVYTDDQWEKLIKVITKKLKTKGKVGPKKLRVLIQKKLAMEETALDKLLIQSIREKIVTSGVAKADGNKLLPA